MRNCGRITGNAALIITLVLSPCRRVVFIITFDGLLSFLKPSETGNQTHPSRFAQSLHWFQSRGNPAPEPWTRVRRSPRQRSGVAYHCLPSFSVTTLDLESQKFAQTTTVGSLAPYLPKLRERCTKTESTMRAVPTVSTLSATPLGYQTTSCSTHRKPCSREKISRG